MIVALMDESEAYQTLRQDKLVLGLAAGLLIVLSGAGVGWIWRQQVLHSYQQQLDAERERRALIGHYDYLTRYANDAVFLVDSTGSIVQVNERASDFYGYSRDEMLGMKVELFRAPGSQPDYERARISIEKRQSFVFESEAVRKDGSVFPVELSVRVFEVEGAQYRQSIIRDITERRKVAGTDRPPESALCGAQPMRPIHSEGSGRIRAVSGSGQRCGGERRLLHCCYRRHRSCYRTGYNGPRAPAPRRGYLDEISMTTSETAIDTGPAGRSIRESGAFRLQ